MHHISGIAPLQTVGRRRGSSRRPQPRSRLVRARREAGGGTVLHPERRDVEDGVRHYLASGRLDQGRGEDRGNTKLLLQ